MRNLPAFATLVLFLSLVSAACSPEPAGSNTAEPAGVPVSSPTSSATSGTVPENAAGASMPASAKVIELEGLDDLRIGQRVPANSAWASRGAQIDDFCTTINSPDFPGVYAIVTGGKVQRITVGQRSDLKLVEGIGVGSTEAEVRDMFPGFREEPHKYVDAPAKYLTAPNAASGDAALRFEIGHDGKVRMFHVGRMPVLGYVEGCA